MREGAEAKARRYLAEGRVILRRVGPDRIEADVRGDGAVWRATWRAGGGWHCPCPARGRCAHLLALGLVVAPESPALRLAEGRPA